MTDIVERIRGLRFVHVPVASQLMEEAAQEIERLRSCHLTSTDRSKIVDELRDRAYCGKGVDSLCERAASEIERLRWADKTSKNVIDRLMKMLPPHAKKGFEQMTFAELEDAVKQWARDRKIIPNSNPAAQLLKTVSEIGELADATAKRDGDGIIDGIGDVLVTLIIYAELSGLTLAECLNEAYLTIKDRRGTLTPDGIFVKEVG